MGWVWLFGLAKETLGAWVVLGYCVTHREQFVMPTSLLICLSIIMEELCLDFQSFLNVYNCFVGSKDPTAAFPEVSYALFPFSSCHSGSLPFFLPRPQSLFTSLRLRGSGGNNDNQTVNFTLSKQKLLPRQLSKRVSTSSYHSVK